VTWQEVRRELSLLTDETVAPEGAMWDSQPAVILDTGASTVTWDLGAVTNLRSFVLQADANDTYTVWGSLDGKDYKVFGQLDPVPNHGLRTRVLNVGGMPARFCASVRAWATASIRFRSSRPTARCRRRSRPP
jgi:hypothetical protein